MYVAVDGCKFVNKMFHNHVHGAKEKHLPKQQQKPTTTTTTTTTTATKTHNNKTNKNYQDSHYNRKGSTDSI